MAAVLAVTMAVGTDWDTSLRCAAAGAAVAVSKPGTATVSLAELRRKILPHASLAAEEKIASSAADLDARVAEWRAQGLRVGFTNGCFDLLHPGHISLLKQAKAACDVLIVGLNSDESVRRLKGKGRPVNPAADRAEVLAALRAVDHVVVFGEATAEELVRQLKPDIYVKGGDYSLETLPEAQIVGSYGGKTVLIPMVEGRSTTNVIRRLQNEGKGNS